MNLTLEEYQSMLRKDFCAFNERSFRELNPTVQFHPNWHLDAISYALDDCRLGDTKRLIINEPPRSLKSHTASVAFPAFLLGHDPAAQIICSSYGQDLASKHAADCRRLMQSAWYKSIFPNTRLSSDRQAVQELTTTRAGFRLSTSVGGVLTGRGAEYLVIDDPLKPEEALSETQRKAVNDWYDNTLFTRLNSKISGRIILIMQRLHEDDLVGHVVKNDHFKVIRFPAIAEEDEVHQFQTPYGTKTVRRKQGEALHPEREPLEMLKQTREIQGEYTFAGQYQQSPAPLDGGLVKDSWLEKYDEADLPQQFEVIFQSWDTATKPTELADYSVCTTWAATKEKQLYLLNVYRKRLDYPDLKRAVGEQRELFKPQTILIEDKSSGTQLIQELVGEGFHEIKRYEPTMNKTMRMSTVTSTIENGFVHVPAAASWLAEYVHELVIFPNGRYDDQVDSTSQALDWFKDASHVYGVLEYAKRSAKQTATIKSSSALDPVPCNCGGSMSQIVSGVLRCQQCGAQSSPPARPRQQLNRKDILDRLRGRFWRR